MKELPTDRNKFALIPGAVLDWPASTKWQGEAGMKHLADLAGANTVEVLTSSTPQHYGSLHKRRNTTCSFSKFLSTAEQPDQDFPGAYLYLAQCAIEDGAPLAALRGDIWIPNCLEGQCIEQVNLWMCTRGSRSSLHYDPYENLLCVVRGCKTVHLFPPATTPLLQPEPLWCEAANHSSVNLATSAESGHPSYAEALKQKHQVVVKAGDALYIPQGWWHQIDSSDINIAVNFWWQSAAASAAQGPMAAFLLRESLRTLTHAHMTSLLASVHPVSQLHSIARASCSAQPAPHHTFSQQQHSAPANTQTDCPVRSAAARAGQQGSNAPAGSKRKHDALTSAETLQPRQSDLHSAQPAARRDAHSSDHPSHKGMPAAQSEGQARTTPSGSSPGSESAALQPLISLHNQALLAPLSPALAAVLQQLLHQQQSSLAAMTAQQAGVVGADVPDQAEQEPGALKLEAVELQQPATDEDDEQPSRALIACAASLLAHLSSLPPLESRGDPMGLQAPVTRLLTTLTPAQTLAVLHLLTTQLPQQSGNLLRCQLPPAAAELLTRHFEDDTAHVSGSQEVRAGFFEQLYNLFDGPEVLFDMLVAGKESFAEHAYRKVVQAHIVL